MTSPLSSPCHYFFSISLIRSLILWEEIINFQERSHEPFIKGKKTEQTWVGILHLLLIFEGTEHEIISRGWKTFSCLDNMTTDIAAWNPNIPPQKKVYFHINFMLKSTVLVWHYGHNLQIGWQAKLFEVTIACKISFNINFNNT